MAFTFGFYNSINHDRKYYAADFARIFDGIINDGVFMNVGEHFSIKPTIGMTIAVGSGRAWFNSTWSYNDADYLMDIDAAEVVQNRIDTIILEIDARTTQRKNAIKILKGTPSANPVAATLTNDPVSEIYQYALGFINVTAGLTAITNTQITQNVGMSSCPFVTGILQTANLDSLYANWNQQFVDWFSYIQTQMEGDVAFNLQSQINAVKLEIQTLENELPDSINEQISLNDKIGDVKITTAKVDTSWMLCDGRAINKSVYQDLYNLIGAKYGFPYTVVSGTEITGSGTTSSTTNPGFKSVSISADRKRISYGSNANTKAITVTLNAETGEYLGSSTQTNSYQAVPLPCVFYLGNTLYDFMGYMTANLAYYYCIRKYTSPSQSAIIWSLSNSQNSNGWSISIPKMTPDKISFVHRYYTNSGSVWTSNLIEISENGVTLNPLNSYSLSISERMSWILGNTLYWMTESYSNWSYYKLNLDTKEITTGFPPELMSTITAIPENQRSNIYCVYESSDYTYAFLRCSPNLIYKFYIDPLNPSVIKTKRYEVDSGYFPSKFPTSDIFSTLKFICADEFDEPILCINNVLCSTISDSKIAGILLFDNIPSIGQESSLCTGLKITDGAIPIFYGVSGNSSQSPKVIPTALQVSKTHFCTPNQMIDNAIPTYIKVKNNQPSV